MTGGRVNSVGSYPPFRETLPGSNVDGHRGNHFMMPWWRRSAKRSGGLPREAECTDVIGDRVAMRGGGYRCHWGRSCHERRSVRRRRGQSVRRRRGQRLRMAKPKGKIATTRTLAV